MSEAHRKQAEAVFQQAADLPATQRGAFLDAQCGADPALRAEVEALLGVSDATLGDFLQATIPAMEGEPAAGGTADIPRQIGRYRILRLIGMGGMGVVYEAEQEAPHRTVALKLLRPGWLSPTLLKRFQHEQEVLGRLHHPGIAQIYEAGVAEVEGRPQPFFAMELVHGRPLTEYAEQAGLHTRQRLELFARICDAVQHAHQHGVIHRDLKPGNILIEEGIEGSRDRGIEGPLSAQPKILDFGVARVTDGDIVLTTMRTDVGQLIGTIAYMSPEQARGDSRELDTRSDVYALGVILYELLTGRLPHDVAHKAIPEAVRVITQDDPTPISSVVDSAGRPLRHLRGDIATIVGRALEKEKGRRYASAAELAADIRRYLADEPIVARPSSTLYQLGKFARRHKALCGATAAVFLVLIAATAVSTTLYVRADRAFIQADRSRRESVAVRDFLKDMIWSVNAQKLKPTTRPAVSELTVRQMLLDAKERVPQYCAGQPELEAEIREALVYAFQSVGPWAEAEAQARRVIELRTQELGPENPATLTMQVTLSQILQSSGGFEEAERLARSSYTGLKRIRGVDHADTLIAGFIAAEILQKGAQVEEAEALGSELLPLFETREASLTDAPTRSTLARNHVTLLNLLARLSCQRGQFREGETRARDALARCLRFNGADLARTTAKSTLGWVLLQQERFAEAEMLLQESANEYEDLYGASRPAKLDQRLLLAVAQRDPERAEEGLRQVVASLAAEFGDTNWQTWNARASLASVLNLELKYEEAEVVARQARADAGRPNGVYPDADDALVVALLGQHRFTEAEQTAGALVGWITQKPRDVYAGRLSRYRNRWGQCLTELGRYAEAEQQFKLAYDFEMTLREPRPRITQEVIVNLVRLYELWDKPDQAAEWRAKQPATQPATTQP